MIPYVLSVLLAFTVLSVSMTTADYCTSSPCIHGSCFDEGHTYRCTCNSGYIGPRCQMEVDRCVVNTCVHGDCEATSGGYQCTNCALGWTGTNCDANIDDCASVTCNNGGSCVDRVGSFTCNCASGFAGVHCESSTVNLADVYKASTNTSSDAWGGKHQYAVDGIKSTNHYDSAACPDGYCCTHTSQEADPWWQLTLTQTLPIRHIKIWNRIDGSHGGRLNEITVEVNGQFCAFHKASNGNTDIVNMYCPEGMTGDTIRISKNGATLSLCEVEVYGYIGN